MGARGVTGAEPAAACSGAQDERIRLMGLLIGAHARLTRVLGRELEEACGLPLTWFDVLVNLDHAPDGRLTMTQLSRSILLTTGGVTRLVDRMAEADLVERQHCPSDRRSIHVAITAPGRAALAEAVTFHLDGVERHLMAPLDAADRAALAAALAKLNRDVPVCPTAVGPAD